MELHSGCVRGTEKFIVSQKVLGERCDFSDQI